MDGFGVPHREIAPAGGHGGEAAFLGEDTDLLADFVGHGGRFKGRGHAQVRTDEWHPDQAEGVFGAGHAVQQDAEDAVLFEQSRVGVTRADLFDGIARGGTRDTPRPRVILLHEIGNNLLIQVADGALFEILRAAVGTVLTDQEEEAVLEVRFADVIELSALRDDRHQGPEIDFFVDQGGLSGSLPADPLEANVAPARGFAYQFNRKSTGLAIFEGSLERRIALPSDAVDTVARDSAPGR